MCRNYLHAGTSIYWESLVYQKILIYCLDLNGSLEVGYRDRIMMKDGVVIGDNLLAHFLTLSRTKGKRVILLAGKKGTCWSGCKCQVYC